MLEPMRLRRCGRLAVHSAKRNFDMVSQVDLRKKVELTEVWDTSPRRVLQSPSPACYLESRVAGKLSAASIYPPTPPFLAAFPCG